MLPASCSEKVWNLTLYAEPRVRMLTIVVGVLWLDDVDVGVGDIEGVSDPDPVGSEEVSDVGYPEICSVDRVKLAWNIFSQAMVNELRWDMELFR